MQTIQILKIFQTMMPKTNRQIAECENFVCDTVEKTKPKLKKRF